MCQSKCALTQTASIFHQLHPPRQSGLQLSMTMTETGAPCFAVYLRNRLNKCNAVCMSICSVILLSVLPVYPVRWLASPAVLLYLPLKPICFIECLSVCIL